MLARAQARARANLYNDSFSTVIRINLAAGHALLGSLSDVGGLRAHLKLERYLGFLTLDPMVLFIGLHAYTVSGYRARAPQACLP